MLPLDRTALRRVAVLGPNAAVARTLGRRQRHRLPAVHGVAARRAARRARRRRRASSTRVTACGRTPATPSPRSSCCATRTAARAIEVRFLGAQGTVLGPSAARPPHSTGSAAFLPGVPIVGGQPRRGAHRAAAPTPAGRRTSSAARAWAASGSPSTGATSSTQTWRWRPATTRWSGLMTPAAARPRGASWRPAQEVELVLRHERRARPAGRCRRAGGGHLPAQRRGAAWRTTTRRSSGRWRLAAAADVAVVVVGTTEEVESEGFDRDVAWRCPAGRTSWSAGSPRRTRAPSWWSTPAPRCCCRGPRTSPRSCSPGSPARSSATRSPTCCSGAVEPGGRLPVTWPAHAPSGCPAPGRSTGCWPTTRGCSSATAARTAAARRTPFGARPGLHLLGRHGPRGARRGRGGRGARRARSGCATPVTRARPPGRAGVRRAARQRGRATASAGWWVRRGRRRARARRSSADGARGAAGVRALGHRRRRAGRWSRGPGRCVPARRRPSCRCRRGWTSAPGSATGGSHNGPLAGPGGTGGALSPAGPAPARGPHGRRRPGSPAAAGAAPARPRSPARATRRSRSSGSSSASAVG